GSVHDDSATVGIAQHAQELLDASSCRSSADQSKPANLPPLSSRQGRGRYLQLQSQVRSSKSTKRWQPTEFRSDGKRMAVQDQDRRTPSDRCADGRASLSLGCRRRTPAMITELSISNGFESRHIGPSPPDVSAMLQAIGVSNLNELIAQTVPDDIRQRSPLDLGPALSEMEALEKARQLAARNVVLTSLIGQGYYGTILPPVVQRNILEN